MTASAASITVVIPAYQAEAFLADGLRSVLAQDPQPAEIVVIDDGSTDRTADIVRSFAPQVRLVSKPNGGEASARNAGLRTATTEWVAFMDADDQFLPGRLAAIVERLRTGPDVDLLTSNAHFLFPYGVDGQCYRAEWTFARTDQRTEILRRNFIFSHTVVKRERLLALGGFDESMRHATDWAMWLVLILNGGRADLIDAPLSLYRVHNASLSANTLAMARGYVRVMEKALEQPLSDDERRLALDLMATQQALVDRELLSDRLAAGPRGVRRHALAVVRNKRHDAKTRARALVALTVPSVGSAVVRRRRREWEIGTMGRAYRRADAEAARATSM
jgi:hypothetical protein